MTAVPALDSLLQVLDDLARALEAGDAEAVLALEIQIARATRALAQVDRSPAGIDGDVRRQLADRISAVRARLSRCRALGESVAGLVAVMTNPSRTYGRGGAWLPAGNDIRANASRILSRI
jgi:hypothetical protein